MTILFAMLVGAAAFFASFGTLRIGARSGRDRPRLIEGWAANRLRQRFRAGAQRARLRSVR